MNSEKQQHPTSAGILIIGNEVLDGLVLDTNSNWMQLGLTALGVVTTRLACVQDELGEIEHGLGFLMASCDIILTSGGLGPTHDDMTLKAIALALGRPLTEDKQALSIVQRQYQDLYDRGIVARPELTDSRRKMAQIPKESIALDNRVGGAPGVMIVENSTTIFCLPGVPSELKFIFDNSVVPWLKENVRVSYYEEVVFFELRDESVFAPFIDNVMKRHPKVYIKSMPATYGTSDVLKVWVSARGDDKEQLRALVAGAVSDLEEASGLKAVVST